MADYISAYCYKFNGKKIFIKEKEANGFLSRLRLFNDRMPGNTLF